MAYLSRGTVCEKLRLGVRQSYRIIGSTYGDLIKSDDVVSILNRSRRSLDEVSFVPNLLTPAELAEMLTPDSGVTEHKLRVWTRRTKNVPPHYRLNKQTIRFSERQMMEWLDGISRIRRRG